MKYQKYQVLQLCIFKIKMTEKKLIELLSKVCDDVLASKGSYSEETFPSLSFEYHSEKGYTPYLELFGTRTNDFDPETIDLIRQVFQSVCTQYGIVFLFSLTDEDRSRYSKYFGQ